MEEVKGASRWFIIMSVLYVITGIVMIVWPHLTLELLGKALGIGMLVIGITHIIIYFTKDHMQGILQMDLTIGVILAAFGAFMLLHADFVGMAIPFGVGILLMIGAITKIQYSLDMKRLYYSKWFIMLIFAIILLVMGLILIYNPFRDTILLYYIAGCLILEGILSIICILTISHRVKQIAKGRPPRKMKGKTGDGHEIYEKPALQEEAPVFAPPAAHEEEHP